MKESLKKRPASDCWSRVYNMQRVAEIAIEDGLYVHQINVQKEQSGSTLFCICWKWLSAYGFIPNAKTWILEHNHPPYDLVPEITSLVGL